MKQGAEAAVWSSELQALTRQNIFNGATMHKLVFCCLIIISFSCPLFSLPVINASEMSYQLPGKPFGFSAHKRANGTREPEQQQVCFQRGSLSVPVSWIKSRNDFRTPATSNITGGQQFCKMGILLGAFTYFFLLLLNLRGNIIETCSE